MKTAEEIAAGLTKAQRQALVLIGPGKGYRTAKEIGASPRTLNGLMDAMRRDIEPPIMLVERDYVDWPRLAYAYRLSPVGWAVRAILQKDQPNG